MTFGISSANTPKPITTLYNTSGDNSTDSTSSSSPNSIFSSSQNTDNDNKNYGFFMNREKTTNEYKAQTGVSAFAANGKDGKDQSYDYVNENKGGKSPIATVYSLTTEATYSDKTDGSGSTKSSGQNTAWGQQQIKGNNVPIGNTFIAYLSNNNDKATAKIGNTDAKGLAHNFFASTDNIQAGNAPGITSVKTAEGQQVVAKNTDGSGKTKLIHDTNVGMTPGNNNLNGAELTIAKYAYALDAQALSAGDKLHKTDSESQKRTSSASTVDIDKDDPYDKFMKKVGDMDGKTGVSEAELEEGIKQISDKTKDGGLFFSKEKLTAFLNGTKKASP